jgi:transcriptional regulator
MYIPEHFAETNIPRLHEFMRRNSFATLVTQHGGAPYASHLHVVLDEKAGAHGALIGHMPRKDALCQDFAGGAEVLAIFHGPHAYVSPAWYEPNPMAVPTWNYTAVHAYGKARILPNEELADVLHRQVDEAENSNSPPWKLNLTPAMRERALGALAGFEITLHRIEGKFKLSQNRTEQDRRNVIAHLSQSEHGREVADWMTEALDKQLERK